MSPAPPHGAEGTLKATVMDGEAVRRSLTRIAHEVVERNQGVEGLVVVGVMSKGDVLARRLGALLARLEDVEVPVGSLDVSRHRDDLHLRPAASRPPSEVPDIDGRTARAAMDALMEYGRPRAIQLAVLVDRGHRELPIRPDYVGKNVPTSESERVRVLLRELDGVDAAVIVGLEP